MKIGKRLSRNLLSQQQLAAEFNINEICLPDVLQQLYQLQRIPVVKEMYEAWQQPDKRLSEKLLDQLTHAFEVRKRIHADYDLQAKPVNAEEYKETSSYVAFSTILIDVLANTNTQGINMRYLNVLLKLMDTILSFKERLNPIEAKCVLYALEVEGSIVIQLMTDKGLRV
ncbi:hypothetical protein [Cohnella rhizosphaerae]|uniref:Uncharacterized protein n=1 Tax=Cohnella rhizosphaerae TaxID=1457232 RepID=A0A9X4L1N1_9BACL|nr:hypothetical protein [Cohnella rhizosphaerae]MDG0811897.1 hypothetical protein [Cohnella rhizosphaerae]